MRVPLFRLQCGANNYDWGKLGKSSAVANFAAATIDNFSIEESKPYAELWMGTHPSNPSKDVETGRSLLEEIQENSALMTPEIAQRYGNKLPFLFKVLSINKALSIQAHPNKKLAEQLHAKDPKNYPDDNHKPEMTIAVTPFSGLCGFRPLDQIAHFLKTVSPLQKLVGQSESETFISTIAGKEEDVSEASVSSNRIALRTVFTKLMESSPDAIANATTELLAEAEKGASFAGGIPEADTLAKVIPVLNGQFPNDIGLFVLFFLNYVTLNPGEAMYLKADDIHAYISGDIIECMASSDNVIRAGFTPKFKDVPTLTSSLTYAYAPPEAQKLPAATYPYATLDAAAYKRGVEVDLYDPPIEEFSVVRTAFPAGEPQPANGNSAAPKAGKVTFDPIDGPSIIICTSGKGTISVGPTSKPFKTGYIYFVGATAQLVLESEDTGDEFISFRAFCELPIGSS